LPIQTFTNGSYIPQRFEAFQLVRGLSGTSETTGTTGTSGTDIRMFDVLKEVKRLNDLNVLNSYFPPLACCLVPDAYQCARRIQVRNSGSLAASFFLEVAFRLKTGLLSV